MLSELHIENIAVIEKADISFSSGLNVLSGETGAGKSIIIDSINAVLGNRTSKELIRSGVDSALVTAVFLPGHYINWFEENDLDFSDEIILQRKISSDGKSSCRINGVPVTAAQLRELACQLVDIHGQNDGLRLLDEKSHLSFLDSFGYLGDAVGKYQEEYSKYNAIKKEIKSLSFDDTEKERLSESLSFKIDEISKAKIVPGECEQLKAKRDLLRNSEKLKEALDESINMLYSSDDNALSYTQNALFFVDKASAYSQKLEEVSKTLNDALFSLKDAAAVLEETRDALDFSEEEYNDLESRISDLDRLQRKYNTDEQGLVDYIEYARNKLDEIEYSDERIEKLKKDLIAQTQVCKDCAQQLSLKRKEKAVQLIDSITNELRELNMPSVRFDVSFDNLDDLGPVGSDDVKFVMSANAGEALGRISKIASGGELSRIMLALKNVFAKNDIVDTMIFDEIDSGVSGISAQRVAEKLYSVSKDKQVMCVTHLPQIAAMADSQYLVFKQERSGRTYTEVEKLDFDKRKAEIARLYGGDNITETTLAAAGEQLDKAVQFKGGN